LKARPYILAENTWKTVQNTPYDVAVLPWGATEAHGLHLPYATDNIQGDYIAAEAARIAWEKGSKPVVLPAVPFGVNTGQLDIRLDLNMMPSTQMALLNDLIDVMNRQDIRRFVIINGHGGNDFRQMLRELQVRFPRVFLCTINWWQVKGGAEWFGQHTDHAARMETSCMTALVPDLVRLEDAGTGRERHFTLKGLRERWAWAQREWSRASVDTGMGTALPADPEKGKQFLDAIAAEIGNFLYELAITPPDARYEK